MTVPHQALPPPGLPEDPPEPEVQRTRSLDLRSNLLASGFLAVIEMGGALAKKGFQASDLEVALLTSGQSLGLLASFFIAHLASRSRKMPLVVWPEVLARGLLLLVAFLGPRQALAFVALHALAQMFQAMTVPARVTIYSLNYPARIRGRLVGRIRQLQLLLTAVAALALSVLLDWSSSEPRLVRLLGPSPFPPHLLTYAVPALAALGLWGTLVFRRVPVREVPPSRPAASLLETARRFRRVWREDRDFRRYENFFFVFGFANIMSIPLTQIHAVENLHADYLELALINVVLVQGLMAATMAFWGRRLDRHTPQALRGILNIIFSLDFLALALSPNVEGVYLGRVCRGVALGGGTLVWMLGALYYARAREDAPVYLGIHTVCTGFRWLTAPFAGVLLKKLCGDSPRPIFFVSFLVVLATAVMMLREARHEARRRPVAPEEVIPIPAPRNTGA